MSDFRNLDQLGALSGKRVLVRVDLNVPVSDGKVTDTTRIERIVPTVRDIVKSGGLPILLSHFGRPNGVVNPEFSLSIVVPELTRQLGRDVEFVETDWKDVKGAAAGIKKAKSGSVVLLENTRFHSGEEENDTELAKRMASLGDVFVNDAFSAAHRAHASTVGVANHLPAAAGRAMAAELRALETGLGDPKRPVIALVGGAKVSTKIELLENLVGKVQALVIGGGMANTFLNALGYQVGKSICEKDLAPVAQKIMRKAGDAHCAIILPVDAVVAWHFEANAPHRYYGIDAVDPTGMILDIGTASVERIKGAIDDARTLIWNGPLGAFELEPFDASTMEIATHVARRTKDGHLISVAGGGDTVAALAKAKVLDDLTYVSTAGGAFLEWMEGKVLPGVEALKSGGD